MLEKIIQKNKWKKIKDIKWDDNIFQDIKDSSDIKAEFNNDILILDDICEIAHVIVNEVEWLICYKWIPLWRFHNYRQCFHEYWFDMYPENELFAIPCGEYNDGTELILKKAGFITNTFEGF